MNEKERFEILLEDIKQKIEIVAEGHSILVKGQEQIKQDIQDVRTELKQDIYLTQKVLRQEIQEVRTELKQDINNVHTELKQDINNMQLNINDINNKVDFIKQSFLDNEVRLQKVEKKVGIR